MKKWIAISAFVGVLFVGHQTGLLTWPKEGAFDADGHAVVRLFVAPDCGQSCRDVEALLRSRRVAYERVDVSRPGAQKVEAGPYPVMLIGSRRIEDNDVDAIVSALAENFGPEVLTAVEQLAMQNHFDEQGKPVVVMYGTRLHPECQQQRDFFLANGIDYHEVDVEQSRSGKKAYDMLRGERAMPLTYVGYRRFNGYKQDEIKQALRELL